MCQGRRARARTSGVVAGLCAFALAGGSAAARPVVVGFDDLPAGTTVGEQYAALGVSFGQTAFGASDAKPTVVASPQASSAPQAGQLHYDPFNDFSSVDVRFDLPQGVVRLRGCRAALPGDGPATTVPFSAAAFARDGTQLDSETVSCRPGGAPALLTLTGSAIASIVVGNPLTGWIVDDLAFEAPELPPVPPPGRPPGGPPLPPPPAPVAPDFGIARGSGALLASSPVVLRPGSQQTIELRLHRNATSSGRVALSATGLPRGVTAAFGPDRLDGTADAAAKLTLTAAPTAAPTRGDVTVVATPVDATAGTAARTLALDLLVQGNIAARVQGIEVTQAVQTYDQPRRTTYTGVALVRGKKTVVRVFADYAGTEPTGGATRRPRFGMVLFGASASGAALPGGPLFPEWAPDAQDLSINDAALTADERNSARGAFTFTLPDAWTHGPIALTARAVGSQLRPIDLIGPTTGSALCLLTACGARPQWTLRGIDFRDPPPAWTISVVKLIAVLHAGRLHDGPITEIRDPTTQPDRVFAKLLALSPRPFAFLDAEDRAAPWARYRAVRFGSDVALWEPTDQFDEDVGRPGNATIGLFDWQPGAGVTFGRVSVGTLDAFPGGDLTRPVTVVAHELFHTLGFRHASTSCGAKDGEPWPVADGRMDSVGLDTTPGSGGSGGDAPPYRVIADTAAHPTYDLMSYCGLSLGDPDHWISARNWNRALGVAPPPHYIALGRVTLSVHAVVVGTSVRITSVAARGGSAATAATASPYTLVARDAAGRVVASKPLRQQTLEGGAGAQRSVVLEGEAPVGATARVEIVANGGVVAARSRSRHAPHARVLSPRRGSRVGGDGGVTVRWTAADPDGGALDLSLDYSHDGGRSFRNVFAGPADRRSVRLPAALLAASANARLRLRVSDGFTTTTTTSARFAVASRPPEVRILEPSAPAHVDAGGTVLLRGAARDDRDAPITGRRLRWLAGGRLLGSGPSIAVALPAGTRRIVLAATDRSGRVATASVGVRLRATTPFFLRLDVPSRIAPRARTATLVVASTQPATLRVGARRFAVGAAARRIRVPVRPGRTTVTLRLTLTAGGTASTRTVALQRR
ncbi:MAG: hypothetical protein JWQ48_1686 [Conexibacter sp.]|nr:hypothetical protein [Conexibacter sp.]